MFPPPFEEPPLPELKPALDPEPDPELKLDPDPVPVFPAPVAAAIGAIAVGVIARAAELVPPLLALPPPPLPLEELLILDPPLDRLAGFPLDGGGA